MGYDNEYQEWELDKLRKQYKDNVTTILLTEGLDKKKVLETLEMERELTRREE